MAGRTLGGARALAEAVEKAERRCACRATATCCAALRTGSRGRRRRTTDELKADALRKFRQLSAPLAAKAVEDTAFYRYGRLLSRVDVGFDPGDFALERRGVSRPLRGAAAGLSLAPCWPPPRTITSAAKTCARASERAGLHARRMVGQARRLGRPIAEPLLRAPLDSASRAFPRRHRYAVADDRRRLAIRSIGRPRTGGHARVQPSASQGWQLKAMREAKLATDWASAHMRPMRTPRARSRKAPACPARTSICLTRSPLSPARNRAGGRRRRPRSNTPPS